MAMATARKSPRNPERTGTTALKRGVAIVVGVALIALTLSVGITNIARTSNPTLAHRWAPYDARTLAAVAERTARPGASAKELAIARQLSQAALERSPNVVLASRTLGLVEAMQGREARAKRLMDYAHSLTRRDLAVQLWLIEQRVAANDIPGTLQHFDEALRTSPSAATILFPVLARATEDPAIIPHMANVLERRPAWRTAFLRQAIIEAPEPRKLLSLMAQLRPFTSPDDMRHVQLLLDRLVAEKNFLAAATLYQSASGKRPGMGRGLIQDGDFEREPRLAPFDWWFSRDASFSADRMPDSRGGSNTVLSFTATGSGSGALARQLLLLAPGQYRLSSVSGEISGNKSSIPAWQIICADGGTRLLQEVIHSSGPTAEASSAIFSVPADCHAQWLLLQAPGSETLTGISGWVDQVAVARITD